jgi:hypothetical protein
MPPVDTFSLLAVLLFMEIMQTDDPDEIYYGAELTALDTATVEADWLDHVCFFPIVWPSYNY